MGQPLVMQLGDGDALAEVCPVGKRFADGVDTAEHVATTTLAEHAWGINERGVGLWRAGLPCCAP